MLAVRADELDVRWPIFGDEELRCCSRRARARHLGPRGAGGYVGRYEAEFERALRGLSHDARHGLCVANGTVALQLALEALDIGVGDEVIVPGLTWQATAAAVLDVNAVPILVDVEPDTYCIDPAAVEARSRRARGPSSPSTSTTALADLDRLADLCTRYDLQLIEDCAHSHGSAWNGRGVGSVGAIGCFSFQSDEEPHVRRGRLLHDERRPAPRSARRAAQLRPHAGRQSATTGRRSRAATTGCRSGRRRSSTTQFDAVPSAARSARAENARRLDEAFSQVTGITPMRRRRGGDPAGALRATSFGTTQTHSTGYRRARSGDGCAAATGDRRRGRRTSRSTHSPLYQPRTKRRYRIDGQWDAGSTRPASSCRWRRARTRTSRSSSRTRCSLHDWRAPVADRRRRRADPRRRVRRGREAAREGRALHRTDTQPPARVAPARSCRPSGSRPSSSGPATTRATTTASLDELLGNRRRSARCSTSSTARHDHQRAQPAGQSAASPTRTIAQARTTRGAKTVRARRAARRAESSTRSPDAPATVRAAAHPNWVTCAWPAGVHRAARLAVERDRRPLLDATRRTSPPSTGCKVAIEMHPGFVVYNPTTLLELRHRVGEAIGANFDPSHLFWQGIDPVEAIRVLADEGRDLPRSREGHGARTTRSFVSKGSLTPSHLNSVDRRSWSFRTLGLGHDEQDLAGHRHRSRGRGIRLRA